jgi:hypothetical protein
VFASKARYGPIPLRWAYGALRGNGPTLAEEAMGRRGFCALREGFCCSLPRLASDRSRSAGRVLALRGIGPARAEEGSGEDGAFALCARGFGVRFQGSLRTDPAPLGVLGAPRDRSCAR